MCADTGNQMSVTAARVELVPPPKLRKCSAAPPGTFADWQRPASCPQSGWAQGSAPPFASTRPSSRGSWSRPVGRRRDVANELERLLASDPNLHRCLNPQTLDDILCCYGDEHCSCEEPVVAPPTAGRKPRPAAPRGGEGRVMAGAAVTPDLHRRLEAAEATTRRVNRSVAEPKVDAAVQDGRVSIESGERLLELAAKEPDTVVTVLDGLRPDAAQAEANRQAAFWTPERERQYAAYVKAVTGEEPTL
jgi:hypothetical protein